MRYHSIFKRAAAGGLILLMYLAFNATATVRYVNLNNASPVSPFTSWATAATNIQDAVDVAVASDEIVVTNGVYAVGGRAVFGTMTNRVAVTKALTVHSVNGPAVTVISGYQLSGSTNGDGAVRCAYLTNSAVLSGFTLTNGATRGVSGVDSHERSGGGVWCESTNAVVSNCVLVGNSAFAGGGGACNGTLIDCLIRSNSTLGNSSDADGGGAVASTLNNCTLDGNQANSEGGGASGGTLTNCVLNANSSYHYGGGTAGGTVFNCTYTCNSALFDGGGAYLGTLNGCALSGNVAGQNGGGAAGATLNNCTLTGNFANTIGGASGGAVRNCIIYYNYAMVSFDNIDYQSGGGSPTFSHCCTIPKPVLGSGNITNEPALASVSHLSAASPCRAAGTPIFPASRDIDGEPWNNPPSIGCDEYNAGAITGVLSVAILANFTNVAPGTIVSFVAEIDGRTTASRWEFDDGTMASNRPYASRSWATLGDFPVVLRAYNETFPAGVSATFTVHVVEPPTCYVSRSNATPVAPYTSWATAATSIQDAVDAATVGGTIVLVTNGTYGFHNSLRSVLTVLGVNSVAVDKPLKIFSVNGPGTTAIQGWGVGSSIRCLYLADGATLSGFTLSDGDAYFGTGGYGGGIFCQSTNATVQNCLIVSNQSDFGGGVYRGTLNNCALIGNGAGTSGGGAFNGILNNCTIVDSDSGGGALSCTLNNCIVYYNAGLNTAGTNPVNYSCTTPMPVNGSGNITNEPAFVNLAGGNLRLQSNSPCINSGNNTYAPAGPDFDGNPRIAGGTVDIGAYEFQAPTSIISYAWLQQYGLPIDGSADHADPDGDHFDNFHEWRAGTSPFDATSLLRMTSIVVDTNGATVTWQSVPGIVYFLDRGINLAAVPPFTTVSSNIVGQTNTTSFTDSTVVDLNTGTIANGPFFYRVGVQ